ncbi:MAG: hypothetical protein Harvfovirus21_14 [Harvfovirus sp.]|uniref:Uncharacterized protein n=1 Tax=Harvfovirus sp. TaxID=2487768 RepID=A0A3G5A1W5_9VIRU|nr:MAG: hypothetical protein Harvfovirus21_14 [Harvfovirus sp.]
MEYRYPPLYKYIIIFVIIFLFLRYYKNITPDKYLWIAVFITLLVILLDYMLINSHPNVMHNGDDTETFDDLTDLLETTQDIEDSESDDYE